VFDANRLAGQLEALVYGFHQIFMSYKVDFAGLLACLLLLGHLMPLIHY